MAEREYTVIAPDGKEVTLIGPEGATQEQVIAQAQQLYKPTQAPKYDLGAAAPLINATKQVVEKTLTAGAGSLPQRIVKGAIVNPVLGTLQLTGSEGVKELAQKVDTATQQGRKERGSEGFDWAEFFGSLGNPQNFLVPLKAETALGTIGRGMGAGAAAGTTQPVLDEDFAAEKLKQVLFGAGAGGLLTSAGMGLGKAKEFFAEAIKPFREAGRDSILLAKLKEIIPADKWDAVKNALSLAGTEDKVRAAQGLPTAKQSAAEATSNMPELTGLAAWEKVLSKIPGLSGKFNAFREAGEQARYENIASLGGNKANITAAETARSAATTPLYKAADAGVVTVDSTFNSMLSKPSMSKVMERAKALSEEQGQVFQVGQSRSRFDTLTNQPINYSEAVLPGTSIHNIKLAFDQLIKDPATFGIGQAEANAIKGTRAQFLKWAENKLPEYGAARETFAAMSEPINRMKVGEQLEKSLNTPLDKERAGAFANAVTESATLLKKATGQDRFKSLDEILSPDELKRVDYVLENLVKKEAARKSGAATTIDANMIGKEGHQLPQFLSATATVANTVLRMARKDANARITNKFGELLMNPTELARFMDGVPPKDANAVAKALNWALPPASRDALAARLRVGAPAAVYEQETKPVDYKAGGIVAPQQPQQGLFQQPQSKMEAINTIAQAAQQYGKPELTGLLTGIAKVESNFDPNAKSKSSTAAGMFQFTKPTQKDYGITNPYDVAQSAGAAAAYIDKLMKRYNGDKVKALAAYNQGPGVIDKGLNAAGRAYAMKVLNATRGG